jgi:hypothetical protein
MWDYVTSSTIPLVVPHALSFVRLARKGNLLPLGWSVLSSEGTAFHFFLFRGKKKRAPRRVPFVND